MNPQKLRYFIGGQNFVTWHLGPLASKVYDRAQRLRVLRSQLVVDEVLL